MSSVKATKDALVQAATTFRCAEAVLNKSLDLPTANTRHLKNCMVKLEEALSSLNSCHTAWVLKAELSDDLLSQETYNRNWLDGIWMNVSDLQQKFETKFNVEDDEPPVQTIKQKLLICSKQMETLKHDISTTITNLTSKLSAEFLPGSRDVYTEMLSNVKDNLNGRFANLMQQILTLDPTHLNENLDELETFRKDTPTSIITIELSLAEKRPSHSSPQPSVTHTRGIDVLCSGHCIAYEHTKCGA